MTTLNIEMKLYLDSGGKILTQLFLELLRDLLSDGTGTHSCCRGEQHGRLCELEGLYGLLTNLMKFEFYSPDPIPFSMQSRKLSQLKCFCPQDSRMPVPGWKKRSTKVG